MPNCIAYPVISSGVAVFVIVIPDEGALLVEQIIHHPISVSYGGAPPSGSIPKRRAAARSCPIASSLPGLVTALPS